MGLEIADGGGTLHEVLRRAGFKFGDSGPHISRTMMLDEISRCLDVLPMEAIRNDFRAAIVERNILGKETEATRKESFRRLRELYALDPVVPIFRLFRELDAVDPASRPLFSALIACARDPLLRATLPTVAGARTGESLQAEAFDAALERACPGHLKPKIRLSTARHIASTWTQSGHLTGRNAKIRVRVSPRPAALAFALMLGSLQGHHGAELFGTDWCRILDLNANQAQQLASQAHREGLLDLRVVGNVVEIGFPRFAKAMAPGGAP
jgi:hypothetical protein